MPQAQAAPDVTRSVLADTWPADALQRAGGRALTLTEALGNGRPVLLTFFCSSCQTVCPVTNQVMVDLGQRLGSKRQRVQRVSISINPDHDHDAVRRMTA